MKKLITWVEIPTENFERSVNFYQKVFDLELSVFESENEKMACFANGEGAISQAKGFTPGSNGVLVSFDVGDKMDETIERIKKLEGKITHPKTKIEAEGRGYFALFLDCEGNRLGLHGI